MSPTPIDQRAIDPDLRAEIESAYAGIEHQQDTTGRYADTASRLNIRPFVQPVKNDVVELTTQAKERSKQPDGVYQEQLRQVWAYTKYINDLRENKLRNQ